MHLADSSSTPVDEGVGRIALTLCGRHVWMQEITDAPHSSSLCPECRRRYAEAEAHPLGLTVIEGGGGGSPPTSTPPRSSPPTGTPPAAHRSRAAG